MTIAKYIDHTILKPDTTEAQVRVLCEEAKTHRFATVFVNSCWIKLCANLLSGTSVNVGSVAGFPLGANISENKADEARRGVGDGASEIDMVMNVGAMKLGKLDLVEKDIATVRAAIPKAVLKVIIETCLLTEAEKIAACQIVKKAGADFVKTSTGFSTAGAKAEDVALMRKTVGDKMGVKASGGIRTYEEAMAMITAGASRIGTSAGVAIVQNK